jgi:hypothetical protein
MEFLLHKLFRIPIKNEAPNQSSVLTEKIPSKDFFLERHFGFISLGKNLDPESKLSQAIYVNGKLKGDGWYRFYIGARGPSEVYLNLNPTSDPAFISEVITKSSSKFGGATALDSKWKEFFLIIEASPKALRAIEKFELTFCRIELEVMGSGQALVPFIFEDKCTGSACIQKYLLSEANAECRIECELSGFKSESSLKIRLMQMGEDFLRKICLEICQRLEIRGFSIPTFLDSKLSDVKVGRYQVRCISNCDPQGSEPLFIKSIWRNKDGVRYEVNFDLFSTLNSKSPILLPLNASWLEGWSLLTLKRGDIPQIELELEP